MNKYYIKFGISQNFNAGSKAMKDIMQLLESTGYKPVLSLPTSIHKIIKLADIPLLLLTLIFKIRRSGTLLYFVPSNFQRIKLLRFFRKVIGFKLICFINDVEFMRMEKNRKHAQTEIESIEAANIVLVPNDNSVHILRHEYGFTNHLIPVEVWDYLNHYMPDSSEIASETAFHQKAVAFAGNLAKSPFIKKLPSVNLNFKIWGNGSEMKQEENIEFMGKKTPDELVADVAGCTWGLVWDGDSIDTCSGLLGTYLRFNNSHKCGLYLAAGIPVIVWKESGMATFVNRYNVGISASSLSEAAATINNLNKENYLTYRKNARLAGRKINNGAFFLEALQKAEELKI